MDPRPAQKLFDEANALVAAGRFDVPAWRRLVAGVEREEPDLAGAAVQMGATHGLVGPDDDIDAILAQP